MNIVERFAKSHWVPGICRCSHDRDHHAYPGEAGTPCVKCFCPVYTKDPDRTEGGAE